MTQISNERKEIARHTAAAFLVEKPPIFHFWDNNHKSDVYILQADNSPQHGVKSYATIGLSDHSLVLDGKPFGTRVELVGVCGSVFPNFDNVLATLAFNVINSNWFCAPGIIFPDVLSIYKLSVTLTDIYFAHPFLWDDRLRSTHLAGKKMAWLLAVPISKKESEFAHEFGAQELEKLLSEKNIDIYNLNRESVV